MQGPGTFSNIIARIVQIIGTVNTGLFVYSPTAALGNLVASITAGTTTDAYGNAVKPGIATYGPSNNFVSMIGGNPPQVVFGTGDAAESAFANVVASIAGSGVTRQLQLAAFAAKVTGELAITTYSWALKSPSADNTVDGSFQVTALRNITGPVSTIFTVTPTGATLTSHSFPAPSALVVTGGVNTDFLNVGSQCNIAGAVPSLITVITTDTVHTVGGASEPAFQNSWSGTCTFQLNPDKSVTVQYNLSVPNPAPAPGNSIVFTFPSAPYMPSATVRFLSGMYATANHNVTPITGQVDASGNFTIIGGTLVATNALSGTLRFNTS